MFNYLAVNTDQQGLEECLVAEQLLIGSNITGNKGTRGNEELGKKAAQESLNAIENIISDADILFVTAGMGGGTGTGAAPVIAGLARKKRFFTVGVVTLPFCYEGEVRVERAADGIQKLKEEVDALIVVSNDKLNSAVDENITFAEGMSKIYEVLSNAVKRVSSITRFSGEKTFEFDEVRQAIAEGSAIEQHLSIVSIL